MSGQKTRKFDHVFVLGSGRCGTMGFTRACENFSNFTAGHETRCDKLGDDRLAYPVGHIEADNRLSWHLGRLDERFGDQAFYVHLTRNPESVAKSYDQRWLHQYSIIDAYSRGILKRNISGEGAARDMVDAINANIRHFLKDKTNVMEIDIDDVAEKFPNFASKIGAIGDMQAALSSLEERHNKTTVANAAESHADNNINVARYRIQKLEKANKVFKDEREKLKRNYSVSQKKLKKKQSQLAISLLPWALLFFPITLILLLYRFIRKRSKSEKVIRASRQLPWAEMPKDLSKHVQDSLSMVWTDGPQAGLRKLESKPTAIPSGARGLFEAYAADTDKAWEEATNKWLTHYSKSQIRLTEGKQSRFNRIAFDTLPKVQNDRNKVSVIMPAYNAQDTIELSVRSILNQTWSNLELIVVNDKSSDETAAILDRLSRQDSRLKVLHNPVNVGPYVSKNAALQFSSGEFVTGHDADDIALPDRLQNQMSELSERPDLVGVLGVMVRLDSDGLLSRAAIAGSATSPDGLRRFAPISVFIKRDALNDVGYWDCVRFGADSEMISRLKNVFGSRIQTFPTLTMLCLDGEGSLTNNSESGISAVSGMSDVRVKYRDSWVKYHSLLTKRDQNGWYREFSNSERPYATPEAMIVPQADVEEVIAHFNRIESR